MSDGVRHVGEILDAYVMSRFDSEGIRFMGDPVFATALRNARDVTSSFQCDFGIGHLLGNVRRFDKHVFGLVRKVIDSNLLAPDSDWLHANCFSFDLDRWATVKSVQARELIESGLVSGVDGTNAIEVIDERGLTVFGCAVASLNRLSRSEPIIKVTSTITSVDIDIDRLYTIEEFYSLIRKMDDLRDDQSWPTTFREYQERLHALEIGGHVLIDGPLMSQNLISQEEGRRLCDRFLEQRDRVFVGVIKSIHRSETATKMIASCLRRGEGYVVGSLGRLFRERYSESHAVVSWADRIGDEFIRCVYRAGLKSFAFECRKRDLPLVVAILKEDCSGVIGHELPTLIEYVDMYLRKAFGESSRIRDLIISNLHTADPLRGFDLTDERSFR